MTAQAVVHDGNEDAAAPVEPLEPETPPAYGSDLLPPSLFEDKSDFVSMMQAAYNSILGKGVRDWQLWEQARRAVVGGLKRRYAEAGFSAPPIEWDAFWGRVDLPLPDRDGNAHVRLIEALLTPYNARLMEHIEYRHALGGNNHFEFTGPTGMGKSTCAAGLAHCIEPIEPAAILEHFVYDVGDLPRRMEGKRPRQTVIKDENLYVSGEGSATLKGMLANIEDTLRASGVNLFMVSPRDQELGTMQLRLEVVMWCPEQKFSLFLAWHREVPLGVVALPWMPDEHYAVYSPWKAGNVERTRRGSFKDNTFLARQVMEAFHSEGLVDFLVHGSNKPTKKDFSTAVELFAPQMTTASQASRVVDLMHLMAFNYDRLKGKFEQWFGVPVTPGFVRVAEKCYKDA